MALIAHRSNSIVTKKNRVSALTLVLWQNYGKIMAKLWQKRKKPGFYAGFLTKNPVSKTPQ
jgi:hypothetical protein